MKWLFILEDTPANGIGRKSKFEDILLIIFFAMESREATGLHNLNFKSINVASINCEES